MSESRTTTSKDAALALLGNLPASRAGLFSTACRALIQALDYRWAGIALLEPGGSTARLAALQERDRELTGSPFPLKGTPCGALYAGVPDNGHSFYCDTLRESFPDFLLLGNGAARIYLGACFRNDIGAVLGHAFVADDVTRGDESESRTFLALVAQRVGAEWVRMQNETRLKAAFDASHDGILITSDDGAPIDINATALVMLGWDRRWLLRHGLPPEVRTALDGSSEAEGVWQGHLSHRRGDGVMRQIEFTRIDVRINDQPCRQYHLRDITERAAQEELRRHYEAIMRHSQDFLALVDSNYRYLAVSRKYSETFQREISDIVGRPVAQIHGERTFTDFIKPRLDRCLRGEDILWQHPIEGNAGPRMVESHLIPCADAHGRVVGVVVNARDITESFELSRQLAHQANHDDLTQLINRREFEACLTRALDEAQKNSRAHALCYLDLDQFKVVNDTAGHAAGDELLKQVAALLQSRVRGTDTLARLGGDEFGILLRDCSLDQARRILDDLLRLLEGYRFRWQGRTFQTTTSIGVVPVSSHAGSVHQLMSAADIACYTAKDLGRNRMHIYEPQDSDLQRRQHEMRLTGQLRTAVQDGRFELFYQPVVAVRDTAGVPAYEEILVRLVGEQGELVQPGTFVGAAERYGLMRHVDEWVIRAVLHNHKAVFNTLASQRVAINLSGTSLADESFFKFVRREIDVARFDPARLCFEITETAAINNLSRVREFMGDLRRLGCTFALDDFGSGLSSFSYLKHLPVDYVKIDGVFVRGMETERLDHALVNAIGGVARTLGISAIAEHLETTGALTALREVGIEYAQGFLINVPKPLPLPH